LITNYSLKKLLNRAWKIDPLSYRLISDSQIREVIDGIENEYIREQYLTELQNGESYARLQKSFVSEYRRSKRTHMMIFSKKSAKIIKQNLIVPKSAPKWDNFKIVADRLNSPELLDYYINKNIYYKHIIPGFHRPPGFIIKDRYGDCDDLANFGRRILSNAGYNVFGRHLNKGIRPDHIGLGIKLEDGSYLLAVDFRGDSRNHMSGPYKTILELDKALGYGYRYHTKDPFYFDW
jgi:hypothetical protein